jgi:hypothetical protein
MLRGIFRGTRSKINDLPGIAMRLMAARQNPVNRRAGDFAVKFAGFGHPPIQSAGPRI